MSIHDLSGILGNDLRSSSELLKYVSLYQLWILITRKFDRIKISKWWEEQGMPCMLSFHIRTSYFKAEATFLYLFYDLSLKTSLTILPPKLFSSLKLGVRPDLEAIMSHNLQYGNVHTNNTTDNTFPRKTLFSHWLEKTRFKDV